MRSRPRRALVCAGTSVAVMLERQLAAAGYAAVVASAGDAARVIEQFAPDVALLAMHNGMDGERLALARRLRAEPSTYALPLVFLYQQDERSLRNTALHIGVDDYFPLATPTGELCARLDALFWRTEAGRRAAPVVGEQRAEIDNFMLLLDNVRADIEQGDEATGTLALVEAVSKETAASGAEEARTLTEAHGFLKLNLRRADSVAFYGPTMLLVYLPRMTAETACDLLTKLRDEFRARRGVADLAVGLASFPADGTDVETLVERAEAAALAARKGRDATRVVAYGSEASSSSLEAASSNSEELSSSKGSQDAARAEPRVSMQNAQASLGAIRTEAPSEVIRSDASGVADALQGLPSAAQTAATRSSSQTATPKTPDKKSRPAFSDPIVVRESRLADSGSGRAGALVPAGGQLTDAADAAARAAAEAGARELARRAQGAPMPRRLLLTVSDPARMAQVNLLIRSAGYDVRAAFDGPQALNLLRIERPDLLVLDYELHGIDGLEALRRLRKQSGGRLPLPVVLLLDAKHERLKRDVLEAGARAVISLPYDPVEFLDTVRRAGNVE
ncbi:MAG TPA: response regulator [Pyrinomonadaceae bacterium]